MTVNRDAQKRARQYIKKLNSFTVPVLNQLAKVLKADRGQRVKGGEWKKYKKAELIKSIRKVLGRGTFADILDRFSDLADKS